MLNIFINTWGNYNENGADGGEWVTLPMTEEELENTLQQIADNMGDLDPEFCIHDYEWTSEIEPRDIGENENIMDLNEEINDYAVLKDWEQKEIAAATKSFNSTLWIPSVVFSIYAEGKTGVGVTTSHVPSSSPFFGGSLCRIPKLFRIQSSPVMPLLVPSI